jgi:hypothetical protein
MRMEADTGEGDPGWRPEEMTEHAWLTSTFSDEMLAFLRSKANGRKRRLLAVGCCRRVLDLMPEGSSTVVEVAEKLADGQATEEERLAAQTSAWNARYQGNSLSSRPAGDCAYWTVEAVSKFDAPTSWDNDTAAWVAQTAAEPRAWVNGRLDDDILLAEQKVIADLVRCIFGNPFHPVTVDPAWLIVTNKARIIYDERSFDQMPDLADALEAAGCTDEEVLAHCRQSGDHVRGCWVVDLLLGKE